MKDYTLKFFREHYLENRRIAKKDKELVSEAFMAGAQTLALMFANFMKDPDPNSSFTAVYNELSEYIDIKNAEVQVKGMTVH